MKKVLWSFRRTEKNNNSPLPFGRGQPRRGGVNPLPEGEENNGGQSYNHYCNTFPRLLKSCIEITKGLKSRTKTITIF